MAAYTVAEAEDYYQHCMLASEPWQTKMSDADKLTMLEYVTRRLENLPWRAKYSSADTRKLTVGIEAAFFDLLVQATIRWPCVTEFPIAAIKPDADNLLNVIADLPRSTAARLLPFLDADYLSPRAQRSSADGRKAKPMLEVV